MEDEIVICGMSGRFPESANVDQFWENLINGVDMVTQDDRRWPQGYAGVPARKGTLKNSLEDFDAEFFNINSKQAERVDPQLRQLLEVSWEAVLDSGMNPSELSGRAVGVFVGASSAETFHACRYTIPTVTRADVIGSATCMLANRLSYAFDIRGPSFVVDTYCSSSLLALHTAVAAIRHGECEGAIVAGANLLLNPLLTLQIKQAGALSEDGKCKAFNASADGYVRSDSVVSIFITKRSLARRSYATVVHTKTNADGYKENGITFPSAASQRRLMMETYKEAGIEPKDVFYVEPHGTGTSAGDGQELEAITSVFCGGRMEPLLIGSTKSNMGHAESAASLCGIVKVLLSIKHGVLPGNLHFQNPNPFIPALLDGRLKVVTEVTKVKEANGTIFGVCATGFGGANVHVILKSEPTAQLDFPSYLPSLVPFSGRTREGVVNALKIIVQNSDARGVELLRRIHEQSINGHEFRGFTICGTSRAQQDSYISGPIGRSAPPLWFIFPGMGTQWAGMGKEIMRIDIIRKSIEKSAAILKSFEFDLIDLLVNQSYDEMKRYLSVAFTAVGIALVDFVKSLNLIPDGFIGHSSGEWLCAYADGCWTQHEAILCQYQKDLLMADISGEGGMASVGLTWEDAMAQCPPSVYPACHNAADNVTLSGNKKELTQFVDQLKANGIFAKEVPTGGLAYHSPLVGHVVPEYQKIVGGVMEGQRARSPKWISTAVPESEWETPTGKFFSASYVVKNFASPVLFHSAVGRIPPNAVVLEIGSHSLLQNILKRTLPDTVTIIPMMKRGVDDNVERIFGAVGTLFAHGLQPRMTALYPPIGTKELMAGNSKTCISSLVQWNYSQKHPLLNYLNNSGGEQVTKVSLRDEEWEFLKGHQIDGRILFPASGYLVLAWKHFETILGKPLKGVVQFENVSFHRATILSLDTPVEFSIKIFGNGGLFEISESETVVAAGNIRQLEGDDASAAFEVPVFPTSTEFVLKTDDLYKDFRLRGYEYSGEFQGILSSNITGDAAVVVWNRDWISFLDTLLQTTLVSQPVSSTGIYLPTGVKKLTIDPARFVEMENGASVYVSYSSERKSIVAQGVTAEDFEFTSTSRRRQPEITPQLQTWEFVPYGGGKEDPVDLPEALKILVDIVLENLSSNTLSVSELSTCASESTPILKNILEIIQSCQSKVTLSSSQASCDLLVCHSWKDFDEFVIGDKGILETEYIMLISEGHSTPNGFGSWNLISTLKTPNNLIQLLRKIPEVVTSETVIEISNTNYSWLTPLQEAMAKATSSSRIWLTSTELDSGLVGLVNCLRYEIGGEAIRCLTSPQSVITEQLKMCDLVMNVADPHGNVGSYRGLKFSSQNTTISEHAYLNVLSKGNLSSIAWIQAPPPSVQPLQNKIPCTVYYAPLNFRDIMLAVGKLSPDALPGDIGRSECILGLEFVGIDEGGRRVMGVVESKGLATHVEVDPLFSWTVPDHWRMEEAATVPVAYATAYYSLILRGKLQKGNSVLITSGTGGVGQAAISIAQSLNCQIFTTVGSDAKKQWLLERFPRMKADHVLNSGTTKFASQILRMTSNRGVDVVLNSLAEEKLQAALSTVAIDGKFLEIGKFDLFRNTSLGMKIFLRNISFHGILIDSLFVDTEMVRVQKQKLHKLLADGIQTGVVQPLPSTIFDSSEAEEAFRFMASGKHMGKVMLRLRSEDSTILTPIKCLPRTYFHPHKVYVLIGGLGGFGLEMASWMINRGMRQLVLCSRSGVTNGYQELQIRRWRAAGAQVFICVQEMDSLTKMERLFQQWMTFGPIGGIFNLAMVLRDGLIENQSAADFEIAMKPKYVLTALLDKVSRKLCSDLDHFVGFSSYCSVSGNEGQSNYGLGNSSLERICEQRRRDGFPGLAIAWGAIGDVGVVHERMRGVSIVGGTVRQPLSFCLQVLDRFLHAQSNGILSSALLPKGDEGTKEINLGKSQLTLRQKIGKVLGLTDEGFELKKELTLTELGLDSLMMAEAREILSGCKGGQSLSLSAIWKLDWIKLGELESNCL